MEQNKETKKGRLGYMHESLARTSKAIRMERGEAISEDLEMAYKREIEDLRSDIKKAKRNQLNMFDFGGTSTFSLIVAKDVEAKEIKDKDLVIALDIRNLNISLELAVERYEFLFGGTA